MSGNRYGAREGVLIDSKTNREDGDPQADALQTLTNLR